jgi:hypothetical protein
MMASSMVLSPISAMETRPVDIRKPSNTSSFAGVRRTDQWHPQPAPAWKHPAKPAVLPCWRGLSARDAVACGQRPRKLSAPSSPGERKYVDANPADRCGRLLPDDGWVLSGDRIVRQERGIPSSRGAGHARQGRLFQTRTSVANSPACVTFQSRVRDQDALRPVTPSLQPVHRLIPRHESDSGRK